MSKAREPAHAMMVVGRTTLAEVLGRLEPGRGAPVQIALRLVREAVTLLEREAGAGGAAERLRPERVRIDFADGTELSWLDARSTSPASPGSPADGYASPEEASGGPTDLRSSMFTLGVILFEALSGGRLYDGEPHEVRARILQEPPPDAGEARLDCPAEVVELLFELLCKDPAGRPSSLPDLWQRLDALVGDRSGWEGEVPLEGFLRGLDASDDATTAIALPPEESDDATTAIALPPEVSDDAPTAIAPPPDVSDDTTTAIALPPPRSSTPRLKASRAVDRRRAVKRRGRLRRDILLVTMLLVLSALVGWLARVVLS